MMPVHIEARQKVSLFKHQFRIFKFAALAAFVVVSCSALAKNLRIVSYNIDNADQSSDDNITNATPTLPVVIQAIGLHHIGTNAQQVDVIGCEELTSSTLILLTTALNNIYGAGTYARDTTSDPNTGGGPDGIIYNTHTVQMISARALKTGQAVLLQSNGTYVDAFSPGGGSNGVTRAPMCYQLRPVGYSSAYDLYIYVSHARSTSDDSIGDARYAEAQALRSDAKYKLPVHSHILYSGDFNLFNGSGENAYKCLTGQVTSDSVNWSDTSAIWGNTNQTQGYDPTSKTSPPTTTTWANVSGDNALYLYGDSTSSLTSRIDIQLPNALMFAAYNSNGGVQLAPDKGDPHDSVNFPSSKYPYAFEVFGNNGTTARSGAVTSTANHSLDELTNATPSASTAYADIKLTGSGQTFTGSDHYPIVGDYALVVPPPTAPTLSGAAMIGPNLQFTLTSSTNTTFSVQASTTLTNWSTIGSVTTDATGNATFQDTNTSLNVFTYYRALWTSP
jgi:hypothetical protein